MQAARADTQRLEKDEERGAPPPHPSIIGRSIGLVILCSNVWDFSILIKVSIILVICSQLFPHYARSHSLHDAAFGSSWLAIGTHDRSTSNSLELVTKARLASSVFALLQSGDLCLRL